MNPDIILKGIVDGFKSILKDNLVGIYLHGSLAMRCYTNNSDIDFLVIVQQPINFESKRALVDSMLNIKNLPGKGLEMSIILQRYLSNFFHPTPYELHYSDSIKNKYLSDNNYVCGGSVDRDLAAHLMVIFHRGIVLWGKEIDQIFSEVPREAYIDSIIFDIENAKTDIFNNPVYIILNLCRVLYYLEEGIISSKLEAGKWGTVSLPFRYHKTVRQAINSYQGFSNQVSYSANDLTEFAGYMLRKIYGIESGSFSNKTKQNNC